MMAFRSFRNALLGGAVLVATAMAATPASAVVVDFSFTNFGNITFTGGVLGSATALNFGGVSVYLSNSVGTGDQTNTTAGGVITPNFGGGNPSFALGLQTISGWTKNWTTTGNATSCAAGVGCLFGNYSASFTSLFVSSSGANNLSWTLGGTLTLPDTTSQPDFLTISFTSSNGTTAAGAFSESSTAPDVFAPEPASMAVLGAGLLGLFAARRRSRR